MNDKKMNTLLNPRKYVRVSEMIWTNVDKIFVVSFSTKFDNAAVNFHCACAFGPGDVNFQYQNITHLAESFLHSLSYDIVIPAHV